MPAIRARIGRARANHGPFRLRRVLGARRSRSGLIAGHSSLPSASTRSTKKLDDPVGPFSRRTAHAPVAGRRGQQPAVLRGLFCRPAGWPTYKTPSAIRNGGPLLTPGPLRPVAAQEGRLPGALSFVCSPMSFAGTFLRDQERSTGAYVVNGRRKEDAGPPSTFSGATACTATRRQFHPRPRGKIIGYGAVAG